MPPRKILNLDPLRLLLMQSGTTLLFKISRPPPPPPPLYETLHILCSIATPPLPSYLSLAILQGQKAGQEPGTEAYPTPQILRILF